MGGGGTRLETDHNKNKQNNEKENPGEFARQKNRFGVTRTNMKNEMQEKIGRFFTLS